MKTTIAAKIPAVAGVLRRSVEVCMLEGLASVDVPDTFNDAGVEFAEAVVGEVAVESGRDAVANCLFITVAKVKPEGVMVIWSTRTPAMLDEMIKKDFTGSPKDLVGEHPKLVIVTPALSYDDVAQYGVCGLELVAVSLAG